MTSRCISPRIIGVLALMMFSAILVVGQDQSQDNVQPILNEKPVRPRPNLMLELDLTAEQVQQVREINQNTKPLMEAAQQRLRESNRNLDIAIYSENARQPDVDQRLAEFQAAQAEIAKIRFMKEFAVRKVLTTEQLAKFRELRSRFGEAREGFQERRRERRQGPMLRRMNRRARPAVND